MNPEVPARCHAISVMVRARHKVTLARAGMPWAPFTYGTKNYHALLKWRMDWFNYLRDLYNKYYPEDSYDRP